MIKKLLHSKNQNYFCTFVIGKSYYKIIKNILIPYLENIVKKWYRYFCCNKTSIQKK